jgi:hypothetical protein
MGLVDWKNADAADSEEERWGFGAAACRHGETGDCDRCETECIHGNYGPKCPDCRAMFG